MSKKFNEVKEELIQDLEGYELQVKGFVEEGIDQHDRKYQVHITLEFDEDEFFNPN